MFGKISKGWRIIISVFMIFGVGGLFVLNKIRQPADTPVMRGYQVASRMGCFSCHGQNGIGGVPNPGSEEITVPSWDGGTPMMYIEDEAEIREWILYGSPKRLMKKNEHDHEHEESHGLIEMPAYEKYLNQQEIDDLVAYFKVVAEYTYPEDSLAQKGYELANKLGCFSCHGQSGLTGSSNPKSFKGYIPPWTGADYKELVRNDDELKSWILEGEIERFERNPLAQFFTSRQAIPMPAYKDVLKKGELEALMAYIQDLNKNENLE